MAVVVKFGQKPSQTLVAAKGFKLLDVDAESTPGYAGGNEDCKALLKNLDGELTEVQEMLFAEA